MEDLSELERLDFDLISRVKGIKPAYTGPFLALAYPQTTPRFMNVAEFEITRREESSDGLRFWLEMLETLKAAKAEERFSSDNLGYGIMFVIPTYEGRIFEDKALFLLTVGTSPEYLDDAMHGVDEVGTRLLEKGLEFKREPIWAYSDYNFCQIPDLNTNRFMSKGLAEFVGLLKSQIVSA
jgi:hypothetical protein